MDKQLYPLETEKTQEIEYGTPTYIIIFTPVHLVVKERSESSCHSLAARDLVFVTLPLFDFQSKTLEKYYRLQKSKTKKKSVPLTLHKYPKYPVTKDRICS